MSDAAAAQIVSAVSNAPQRWSVGLGHYIHGQASRIGDAGSSLPRSPGQITYFFDVGWWDPAFEEAAMTWVDKNHIAMRPFSSAATYIDYLSSNDTREVRAAYGKNYHRLAALKRNYDPYNFFHLNRNIAPL